MQPTATKAKLVDRCAAARELLPAYVEQELGAAAIERVRTHLAACATCRREEAQYRRAFGALASRAPARPGDLYPGFAAKLALQSRRSPVRQLRWAVAGACAVLAVAAGAIVASLHLAKAPLPNSTQTVARTTPAIGTAIAPIRTAQAPPSLVALGPDEPAVAPERAANETHADESTAPAPARHVKRHPAATRGDFGSFLDVRPQVGETARQQLQRHWIAAHTHAGQGGPGAPGAYPLPLPDAPADGPRDLMRPVRYVPAIDEQIRVGDRVSRVKGDAGLDARGRLAVIRLSAETTDK